MAVESFEADSKFFRSLVVALPVAGFLMRRPGEWLVVTPDEDVEAIAARLEAPPGPVPATTSPEADRYLHVRTSGEILPGEIHVYTSAPPRGVGYRVIVPLRLADGRSLLLDRGFVPIDEKDVPRHLGPITVEGNLDWPRETDSLFTAAPDLAKNIWFARDVPAMAKALDTQPILVVASFVEGETQGVEPIPVAVEGIPNNHLSYAVQWFLIAATWAGMTVALIWRIRQRKY